MIFMRKVFLLFLLAGVVGCKKDSFTTEPQISFVKFDRNSGSNLDVSSNPPHIILEVTDKEGDLGLIPGSDTAKIYMKNLLTNRVDSSLTFPDLGTSAKKNFKGEVSISLFDIMGGRDLPVSQRPYTDTLFFEIYIKDFAKNKSNVLVTNQPFIYHTLP